MKFTSIILMLPLLACSCAIAQSPSSRQEEPPAGQARHTKKGVCLTTKNTDTWLGKVKSLNASWHYSWGSRLPDRDPAEVEFVPMIWGYWGADEKFLGVIRELTVAKPEASRECLLGFNEPDGKKQANLSVAQAVAAWPYLMQTGRRLGSPAAVHAEKDWMQEFMKQTESKKYRVDFICVHWYGGPNAPGFVDYLKKVHAMYDKPIWITEFAVADWKAESIEKNKFSPEKVLQFMKEVLPKLDELDFVERYAWFSAGPNDKALGSSALFKEDGDLTPLGQFYASHN